MSRARLTLILGGAASGKSLLAEKLAAEAAPVTYVATAEATDDEMAAKIKAHQARRPTSWRTIEVNGACLDHVIAKIDSGLLIVDCLTVYAARVMAGGADAQTHLENVIDRMRSAPNDIIVVSNEVGLGIVPAYADGRTFRELLGRVNQRLAALADNVYLMTAGLPVTLKGKELKGSVAALT